MTPEKKMHNTISTPNNYFICSVQRSGKSWLCDLLTRLRHFGAPEEYLNYLSLPDDQLVEGKSLQTLFAKKGFAGIEEFVHHVNSGKTGLNEPVGLVIQANQLQLLANQANLTIDETFNKLYSVFAHPTIFFLKRKDMAAQAVSLYFVAETGMAHAYQKKSKEDSTYKDIEYDQQQLSEWYDFSRKGYEMWDKMFKKNRITPKQIAYEDLKNNLYKTISGMTRIINGQFQISSTELHQASVDGFRKLQITKKTAFKKKFKEHLSKNS